MAFISKSALFGFALGVLYLAQLHALPIPSADSAAVLSSTTDLALPNTTAIDTLSEPETSVRVKRQGG
ncbi:unnamed protein product [Nippostrongylus brasiliensis]|uniref:Secreted protein n=1 Tax=Nippostrongylus brasiliensis TaxID=27835 RepID=A0A0N4Y300_NIPBR|nr:unnamed protein product [Nippostrongylus brasiliensis]